MKTFITLVTLLTSTIAFSGSSLKHEGSCAGTLSDGSAIAFTYYSDFDGCKNSSTGAINFTQGKDGIRTGTRKFSAGQDIYKVVGHKVIFADSTGNTSGKLQFLYKSGKVRSSVTVQCEVRDYEYGECN